MLYEVITEMPSEMIVVESPDTVRTPDSGTSTASRQTLFTGQAVIAACNKLKAELNSGKTLEDRNNFV